MIKGDHGPTKLLHALTYLNSLLYIHSTICLQKHRFLDYLPLEVRMMTTLYLALTTAHQNQLIWEQHLHSLGKSTEILS